MTPREISETDAPFWGFGEIFAGAAGFMLALLSFVSIATYFLGNNAKLGYWALAEEFAAYVVLFAILKAFFHLHHRPLLHSLGWGPQCLSTVSLVGIGFFLFLIGVFLQILLRMPDNTETPFEKMLYGDPFSRFVLAAFGVSAGPIIEELLFRGLLQPVFVSMAGVFPGIVITSVLFAGLHLQQNAGMWQSGVVIFIAGFGFGVVRHLTGSTRASTITHIAYNTLPFAATLMQGAPLNHK